MAYWAVCRTECGRERFAVQMLALRGFRETYLPRIKGGIRSRGRPAANVALFPNYLFVAIVDVWWDAAHCPGVVTLLRDGIQPAKVRNGVVEAIKARELNGFVVLPERSGFKAGDKVRVIHGPFTGLPGLYAGQSAKDRVRVLLTLFGASRQVTMAAIDIEAV